MTTPERAGLEAVIGQLEKNWQAESAHQALLDYANEKGLLPDAARFYRQNIETCFFQSVNQINYLSLIKIKLNHQNVGHNYHQSDVLGR